MYILVYGTIYGSICELRYTYSTQAYQFLLTFTYMYCVTLSVNCWLTSLFITCYLHRTPGDYFYSLKSGYNIVREHRIVRIHLRPTH